ncbi:hypothetical protein HPP92_002121 [Vanilla planifolia]|uniref:Peptidase A1 domain-containing protein n=1 Tax=Vanilla planifolia TaxID=51239 RepID=A0A835RZB1_VANPL|nr:hypothetical protein HPP92_002121 [Vanilla planifolia]
MRPRSQVDQHLTRSCVSAEKKLGQPPATNRVSTTASTSTKKAARTLHLAADWPICGGLVWLAVAHDEYLPGLFYINNVCITNKTWNVGSSTFTCSATKGEVDRFTILSDVSQSPHLLLPPSHRESFPHLRLLCSTHPPRCALPQRFYTPHRPPLCPHPRSPRPQPPLPSHPLPPSTPHHPHYAEHFMRFSIGTPPVSVLAVMDTGSDLTWLRCTPCADCFGRDVHVFHPTASSTYETLPAIRSPANCSTPTRAAGRKVPYQYGYGDGSLTTGVISTETLTFDSTEGKQVSIPHVAFGCGHNNSRSFDAEMFGLAGLGGQSISLVSQLGPLAGGRFSYCLTPFRDNTSTSFMNFGGDAVIHGENVVTTALVEGGDQTFYFVTLQGVSVGNQRINANAGREEHVY